MGAGTMSNAEKILSRLDALLAKEVDLTLYGRAALLLGFAAPPPDFALSLDVDAVLWIGQAEALEKHSNFWEALEQVNLEFEEDGLYMTHLFDEDQVVLRENWLQERVVIALPYNHLKLHRLADADLLLSKLMRYDPTDLDDLTFIIQQARFSPDAVATILKQARLPDSEEIHEQVMLCTTWLRQQGLCSPLSTAPTPSALG